MIDNYLNLNTFQNSMKSKKIRAVQVNPRGQIVIPEDMRQDFGIECNSTLILLERGNQIILKKELDVLKIMEDEEKFFEKMTKEAMKRAWTKEDEVWDKIYKKK